MTTQGAGESSGRLSVGTDQDRESSVLGLLRAEYSDPAQTAYLTDRFGFRLLLTHRNTRKTRAYFFVARTVVFGVGTLLPAVVALQSQSHGTAHTWLSVSAIVLSVVLAITTGLLQTSRMDQRWRLHHWLWIELRNEGWALAEQRRAYADKPPSERFSIFVERIEVLLDKFESGILAVTGKGSDDPGMAPGP